MCRLCRVRGLRGYLITILQVRLTVYVGSRSRGATVLGNSSPKAPCTFVVDT